MYSVAPNPPRNPITTPLPTVDQNNTLSRPTGPEYQFSVGEGVYVLRDDLLLGFIPPHPTESITQSVNVLDTKPLPPTASPKLSLAFLAPRRLPSHLHRINAATSTRSIIPQSIQETASETSYSGGSENGSSPFYGLGSELGRARAFGHANAALSPPPTKDVKDPLKRRKPKSNIVKSSSSFVSRVSVHDSLTKRLAEHKADGAFAFVNNSRALLWLDLSSTIKAETLTKILFTKAQPLCHDFNPLTKTSTHLDLAIGFSTADIIWYEAMTQKYTRINKNGVVNPTPISHIRWMPNSDNYFIAAHFDGSLIVYDKEKEDAPFIPEVNDMGYPRKSGDSGRPPPQLHIKKSVHSKNQKNNPISYWKVTNDRINAFEFSPDQRHLAIVSEDGTLRVIDFLQEQLLDLYSSYYGGVTCVCWSPNGRYLVTGGQDDIVSIWSVADKALISRCEGHRSWITAVAFDPWRCDEKTYRIGSVGEDCRLLLWDFSVGMLHRPRAASIRQRGSITAYNPLGLERTQSQATVTRTRSDSLNTNTKVDGEYAVSHPVQPRLHSATLPPVMSKIIDEHPLSWIGFEEDCILTVCKAGHIRTWDRPKDATAESVG